MQRPHITALLAAGALAACDTATDPRPTGAPALALGKVSPVHGYNATVLPLVPRAINDSGVIVGYVGDDAARYLNGTLTLLPRHPNFARPQWANAVNRRGATVGTILQGPGLYWRYPTATPELISTSPYPDQSRDVFPAAVNNAEVVVGSFSHRSDYSTDDHAFRWSGRGTFEDITPPGYTFAVATDVNDAGYIVGLGSRADGIVRPLRWAPGVGNKAEELSGRGRIKAIDSKGLAIGTAQSYVNGHFDTPWSWGLAGQSAALTAPSQSEATDISEVGRVVGNVLFNTGVNSGRPWTVLDGHTVWLPSTHDGEYGFNLRVGSCGAIIGEQRVGSNDDTPRGVLWTKLKCDAVAPPSPF